LGSIFSGLNPHVLGTVTRIAIRKFLSSTKSDTPDAAYIIQKPTISKPGGRRAMEGEDVLGKMGKYQI
jgi:hypothetical protein